MHVLGLEAFEGFQCAIFAVDLIVGVDGNGVKSASSDDIVVYGGFESEVW